MPPLHLCFISQQAATLPTVAENKVVGLLHQHQHQQSDSTCIDQPFQCYKFLLEQIHLQFNKMNKTKMKLAKDLFK
jgi:hypothetical protein